MDSRNRRAVLSGLVVVSLLATFAFASSVDLPYTFTAGTTAKASEVNGNFAAVKAAVDSNFSLITALQASLSALVDKVTRAEGAVTAVQNALQSRATYYAVQNQDLIVSQSNTWHPVPGASVTFSTSASTRVLLTANGTLHQYNGPAAFVDCRMRFVVDGAAVAGTAEHGSVHVIAAAPWDRPGNRNPFMMREMVTLAAGSHTVSVELARSQNEWALESGECGIYRWTFSRTHLTAETL